ncbi:MAG TPA: tripartite tricarboxylate transporter substrate binding protein, partial [Pseudolabrys sp.]|nr:tripartite tricarboxylate transporter substrate binding protein [Pseudolabrys sp.]
MRGNSMIIMAMAIGAGAGDSAAAQGYPERVVQIVVPASAGSSADILGRVLADGFSNELGKPFIVVDKPGANGVLGTADVARATPDGYTLMHGATYSITVQPLTDQQAGYSLASFTPICQTFKNDQVVVVPPNSPLKTVRDIITAAREKPGALNVGIPGIATIPHLAMVQFADQAKVAFNNVPYKGPAEELQAIRSGQIDFAAVPLTAAAGSGLVMPGLFAETRNPSLPNVPTFKEQGYDVAPLSFGGL